MALTVAFDDAGDGRIAEDHGEIALDDLPRLDDDRTEVRSPVVDRLRVGSGGAAGNANAARANAKIAESRIVTSVLPG